MAEWSIAAVLKTVDLRGSGGSNPSLSATKNKKPAKPAQQKENTPKTNLFVFGVFYFVQHAVLFLFFVKLPPKGTPSTQCEGNPLG